MISYENKYMRLVVHLSYISAHSKSMTDHDLTCCNKKDMITEAKIPPILECCTMTSEL